MSGIGNGSFSLAQTGLGTSFLAGTDVGITTEGGNIAIVDPVAFASNTAFSLLSGGGDISVVGGMTLGNNSTAAFTSGGGAVSLAGGGSGIDGAGRLSVAAGTGAVTIGTDVGAATPLSSLSLSGGALTLPGSISTSGTQSYTGTAASQGSYVSSAGGIEFQGQLNLVDDLSLQAVGGLVVGASVDDASGNSTPSGRSNLTLSGGSSSAVAFNADVGATTPIGTLTARDATSVTATGSVRAANIVTTGVAGKVTFLGIETDGTAGLSENFAIDLQAGSFDLPGPFATEAGTGMRLDLGSSTGTALLGSGTGTWDNFGGTLTQAGSNGTVNLGADIVRGVDLPLLGDVTLNSTLELASENRIISAQNVNILGGFRTADGQGGVAGLTLRSTGNANRTTLRGLDGSLTGTGLYTLIRTLAIEGRSTITGPVGTVNGMDFGGDVTVGVEAPTTLQVVRRGDIIFQGNILGSGAASSLSLQTDPSQTANTEEGNFATDAEAFEADSAFPIIEFGGNIGTASNRLGSLTINEVAHTTTPALPTIISRSDVEFFLENNFTMGVGEKFTVLGNLTLNTQGGIVTLSDLTVAGDLTLNGASEIVLQNRGGDPLIGYSNPPVIRGLGEDLSGDIVLLGTLVVENGTPVRVSGGNGFNVATPTGIGVRGFNVPGVILRQFGTEPGKLTIDDFGVVAGDVPGVPDAALLPDLLLDLRADGAVVQDVTSALSGVIPRDSEKGKVTQETRLSKAQLEKLQQLNINAVDRDGIRLSAGGPRVYDDISISGSQTYNAEGEVTDLHQVSVNRMSSDAVERVLGRFDSIFYSGEGAERGYDPGRVKQQIESAVLEYFEANEEAPFDAAVIWDSLITGSPEQVEAARSLYEVRLLLEDIERLGLTKAEAESPRQRILGNLYTENVVFESNQQVGALIAVSQPILDGSPAPLPSGEQDAIDSSMQETEQQP